MNNVNLTETFPWLKFQLSKFQKTDTPLFSSCSLVSWIFLLLFKAGIKHNGGVGKKPSRGELVWRFTDLPKCTEVLEKFSLQKDLKTKLVDAVLLPKTQLKH